MTENLIDLEKLHNDLKLSDEQKKLLSDAFEELMNRYQLSTRDYFEGVADGINHCYKIINNINDDYNTTNL